MKRHHNWSLCAALLVPLVLSSSNAFSQTSQSNPPKATVPQTLNKYPGLLTELGRLVERIRSEVQTPASRHESSLLPLLPPATTYYVALANYGAAAQQALAIFHDQVKQSPALRDWYQGELAKNGPELEGYIEKFAAVSQYLGDEIVLAGETGGGKHSPFLIAELRRPGLKEFMRQMLKDMPAKSKTDLRVLDATELAAAKPGKPDEFIILVRPDFVVASVGLDAVRAANRTLDAKGGAFASTPFGQRLTQSYQGGASVVAGGNVQQILSQNAPPKKQDQAMLDRSGFNDAQYLVWERKEVEGHTITDTELSFIGPRRGAASWLASPASLGGLEFVSPKSAIVLSLALKNPVEIFDDIQQLARISDPNAFASLPQMEQAMHVSLREDLLNPLQGEITLAIRDFDPKQPVWNLVLRIKDPVRLRSTFDKLFGNTRMVEEQGIQYHSLMLPAAKQPVQIDYAFADDYLILSSSHEAAVEAVTLHKHGESLAKSRALLAAFPAGRPHEASALVYEDAFALMSHQIHQLPAEIAQSLSVPPGTAPFTFWGYGEEKALRSVSTNSGADAGMVLIGAAIAVPNLLRARIAANESSAAGSLRTINTAQVTYSAMYPQRTYAADLATLGMDPRNAAAHSANHAGLINKPFSVASCVAGEWCVSSGYRFTLSAVCKLRTCKEYVAIATPDSVNTGTKNFCSTSDNVIHMQAGATLSKPITVSECERWPALQ